MTSRELQRKYVQLQMLKQQFAGFVEQKNALDEKVSELSNTINALEKLGSVGAGEEMWSSLGSGAFLRSGVKDKDNVLLSVGAGVVAKKSRADAEKVLQSRLEELNGLERQILTELSNLAEQISTLEPEVEKLVEKESEKEK